MRLHEQAGTLNDEFHVRAGAHPADVRIAYAGATGLSVDKTGALLIQTEMGTLRDAPPVSYQVIDGARVPGREPLCHVGRWQHAIRIRDRRGLPAGP